MSPEALGREYVELYEHYSEADATASELQVFEFLEPVPGGRYLNYGCGRWSESIPRLRAKGYDVYGYEPFVQDAAELPSYMLTNLADIEAEQLRFDGIISHNIIEHLQDPVAVLKEMSRWLSPRGRMVHASPCYAYAYDFSRFHLMFFVGRSAEYLASSVGFSVGPEIPTSEGQIVRVFDRVPPRS